MIIKIWNLCGTVILECENGRIVCFFCCFLRTLSQQSLEGKQFYLAFSHIFRVQYYTYDRQGICFVTGGAMR